MPTRRGFLTGLAIAGLMPTTGWSAVDEPEFLSAAKDTSGKHWLVGLSAEGDICFQIPLPDRGHAAAAHPFRAEAVAFARRPGNFARVIDCHTGQVSAELTAPYGRHFYGHGVFSADGRILFTTENDFDATQGVIGVWDAAKGFARIGEFLSGGTGPHDMALMPQRDVLVVANGGIETHPDSGRTKLNLAFMQSNLTYLGLDGQILEQVEIPGDLHKNSIRHLAVHQDGTVAFAMQWQGDRLRHPPLLGLHQRGKAAELLIAPETDQRQLQGYAGSIAISGAGNTIALTSPRGGCMHVYDRETQRFLTSFQAPDICGLAAGERGFVYTTGDGGTGVVAQGQTMQKHGSLLSWDNHLIVVR